MPLTGRCSTESFSFRENAFDSVSENTLAFELSEGSLSLRKAMDSEDNSQVQSHVAGEDLK